MVKLVVNSPQLVVLEIALDSAYGVYIHGGNMVTETSEATATVSEVSLSSSSYVYSAVLPSSAQDNLSPLDPIVYS